MSRRKGTELKAGNGVSGARRARDVVGKGTRKAKALFGGFWREGEMALFFGQPGVGKSLLAVQIADALAKGRAIAGVEMPKKRSKVLYVDLILSESQFSARYSRDTSRKGPIAHYVFSQNMYHERPADNVDLVKGIAEKCLATSCSVVIVDDLSAITRSDDGTRETLPLVQQLKRMCPKYGLSVMVLADSIEPPRSRDAGEADLRRSRQLCSFVDSAFMMEGGRGNFRELSQTRSQTGEHGVSTAKCELKAFESGLVGFTFEKRVGQLTEKQAAEALKVKELRDAEMSLRDIVRATGIHKSTVERRLKQWTPQLRAGKAVESKPAYLDHDEAEEREASRTYGFDTRPRAPELTSGDVHADGDKKERSYDVANIPFAAGLGHRSVFDLEIHFDAAGQLLYVEIEDEYTGKPLIWYSVHQKTGVITRHERRSNAVHQTRLRSKWLPRM